MPTTSYRLPKEVASATWTICAPFASCAIERQRVNYTNGFAAAELLLRHEVRAAKHSTVCN